jgi:hypothetical protein
MKKNILIGIVAVLVVLAIAKDQIIKSVVMSQGSQILGAKIHLDSLDVGLFKQSIRIKGLKVYNPPGFPNEVMVDIPEISVDADIPSIMKGKLHLPLVIVNLNEMVLIKNKEGKLNVDSLKVVEKKGATKEEKTPQGKASKPVPMQIDQATLNLGKVVVKDYTKGEPPSIQGYDIGVRNKTFKNITSAEQFVTLVLVQAMGPTALKNAAVYGAASALGVAFLPVGIAGIILGKDSAVQEFDVSFDKAYNAALAVLKKAGEVTKENKQSGSIKGKTNGVNIDIEIIKKGGSKVGIQVTGRKYMLPKPEVAEGVMYQISETLK